MFARFLGALFHAFIHVGHGGKWTSQAWLSKVLQWPACTSLRSCRHIFSISAARLQWRRQQLALPRFLIQRHLHPVSSNNRQKSCFLHSCQDHAIFEICA
ncbi:hypothetical protein BDR07DRAFT_1434893, partial [Suillus spraguei]